MAPTSATPLRVLFDAHQLGRRQTGNETYVRELLGQLARRDDVAVTALVQGRDRGATGLPPAILARSVPRSGLARLGAMALETRRRRPEVLHAVYFAPPVAACPVVLTVHDISFEILPDCFGRLERLRARTLIRDAARRARLVVTVSETSRREIVERWAIPPERVVAIHNGVGERFLELPRREPGPIGDRPLRVLAVGTLQPRKNLLRLLAAIRRVAAVRPVRLRVVGPDGHQAAAIRAALEGAADVSVVGYLDEEALVAEYAAADLLAYPSLYEGFGLPVIEAMAAGLPVVTSTGGALPEVAGDAALLVDPFDEAAMAEAIMRVAADDTLRADLAARGRARAAGFRWAAAADRLVDAWREAADG